MWIPGMFIHYSCQKYKLGSCVKSMFTEEQASEYAAAFFNKYILVTFMTSLWWMWWFQPDIFDVSLANSITCHYEWLNNRQGAAVQWLGHRTHDWVGVGSTTGCSTSQQLSGMLFTCMPPSWSNITWYWPNGNVLWLERLLPAWLKFMAAYCRMYDKSIICRLSRYLDQLPPQQVQWVYRV